MNGICEFCGRPLGEGVHIHNCTFTDTRTGGFYADGTAVLDLTGDLRIEPPPRGIILD